MLLTNSVRRAALINPRGTATIHQGEHRTWAQFHERVAKFAAVLIDYQVRPGDRVAVTAANRPEHLEVMYACFWAGAIFVPLSARTTPGQLKQLLADATPRLVVTDATTEIPAAAPLISIGQSAIPRATAYEALLSAARPAPDACAPPEAPAAIFYTGGTTGGPKGAVLTGSNLASNAMNCVHAMGFQRDSRFLHTPPLSHVGAHSAACALTLHAGTHIFLDGFDVPTYLHAISELAVTDLFLVPTMIAMLTSAPESAREDLHTVRSILYGGSPISPALLDRALQIFPRAGLRQFYGATEVAGSGTTLPPADHSHLIRRASAGQPLFSVEVQIADPETDQRLKPRQTGEIVIRSPGVMQGYWQRPDLTAAVLRRGWLRTGDLGYLDEEGYLFVVDRLADMIVTGGENVYSADVDRALTRHPAVLESATIGIPDPIWGEAVHAIVVLRPGTHATEAEIIAHCHKHLSRYQCPRSIELRSDRLPCNSAGKILKKELRAMRRSNPPP